MIFLLFREKKEEERKKFVASTSLQVRAILPLFFSYK